MRDEETSARKKVEAFVSNIILLILVVIVFMTIFSDSRNEGEARRLVGIRPVVVVSGSMLPEIQINSVSIMRYCGIDDLEVGDVAVYKHPDLGINITHRVVEKDKLGNGQTYINTKGDANNGPDNIDITDNMVIGEITTTFNAVAPYVSLVMMDNGKINMLALIPLLLVIATAVTVIGMLLYSTWMLLYSIYIIRFKPKNIEKLAKNYDTNNKEQFNNKHLVDSLAYTTKDTIKLFTAKVMLAMAMSTFEEASKGIKKAQDRLKELTDTKNNEN